MFRPYHREGDSAVLEVVGFHTAVRPAPPPLPLRQTSPTRVELQEGGGWIALFGLLLCAVGVTLAGLGVQPIRNPAGAPWWTRPTEVVLGLAFVAVGGALALGRRKTSFDRHQARIIRQLMLVFHPLVLPIRHVERSVSQVDVVVIAVDSNSDSGDIYSIQLAGDGSKDFKIWTSTRFEKSWALAEFLAQFLGLNLADLATDHDLVLSSDQVGKSLPERLRSGEARLEPVGRPMTMRSETTLVDGAARIVIAGRRSLALPGAIALVTIGASSWLSRPLLAYMRESGAPDAISFPSVALIALVAGIVPLLWAIHAALTARRMTVATTSRTGIVIERHVGRRTWSTSIPAAEIIALDYGTIDSMIESARRRTHVNVTDSQRGVAQSFGTVGSAVFAALKGWVPSKGLIVKSRRGLFVFGEGLPGEDLRYLQSVVSRALVGA